MVTTITIDEISEDIMENFFTILKADVVSVDVPNPSTSGTDTFTVKHYASEDNDVILKKKTGYPIITVSVPVLPEDALTYRDMLIRGTITVTAHVPNSRATTKFKDLIRKAFRDNKSSLRSVGLDELKITEEDGDSFDRNGFRDHWLSTTYSFEYDYTDGS